MTMQGHTVRISSLKPLILLAITWILCGCPDFSGCSDYHRGARASFDTGIKYYNEGDYDEAVICFSSAIRREYKPAECYYYLGNIYAKENQQDEAIVAYEKAIGLKAKYSEAYYGLARSYSLKGAVSEAIQALEKAIDLKRKWRNRAKDDQAFLNIRDAAEFRRLLER